MTRVKSARPLTASIAAAVVLTLAASNVSASAASTPSSSVPRRATTTPHRSPRVNHPALGIYAGYSNVEGLDSFQKMTRTRVSYAMDFVSGKSWQDIASPTISLSQYSALGYHTIWGVPMLPDSGGTLSAGATGAYDTYFSSLAAALVAAGQGNAIIRLGWEFNGFWFPWSALHRRTQFVAYWRQIVTTMRAAPGAHFTVEWNPDIGEAFGAGDLGRYYPGDAYVDYVGLDVYDGATTSYPGAAAEFSSIQSQPGGLDWLAGFSARHHKPIVFPEWGLGWGKGDHGRPVTAKGAVGGGDDALFVKKLSEWSAHHNVFEATFWDYGSSQVGPTRNPQTGLALRRYWASP